MSTVGLDAELFAEIRLAIHVSEGELVSIHVESDAFLYRHEVFATLRLRPLGCGRDTR